METPILVVILSAIQWKVDYVASVGSWCLDVNMSCYTIVEYGLCLDWNRWLSFTQQRAKH
jgi:hypothetical protein